MYLAAIAADDEAVAFSAVYRAIGPALRSAAEGPLRRARHAGRPCCGPDDRHWCAECEQDLDDRFLAVHARLRKALLGTAPRTRGGEAVREMEIVLRHVTSAESRYDSVDDVAAALRRRPRDDEAPWLRAMRAQVVHYSVMRLEAQVRRSDAVNRGASARPGRDLQQSDWAAPLRDDPVAFNLLLAFIGRLRRNAPDPYQAPADILERHALDQRTAQRLLGEALRLLQKIRPAFFAANVTMLLPQEQHSDATDAQCHDLADVLIAKEDEDAARRLVTRLITPVGPTDRLAPRRAEYRTLLTQICRAAGPEVLTACAQALACSDRVAARFVSRLVNLVARADVEWVQDLCTEHIGSVRVSS